MRYLTAFALSSVVSVALSATPVEIVLARCKEDITWLERTKHADITTVYEKCGMTDGPGRHLVKPNLGREGGTYLQHIVDNYDTLADWTVFSQAEEPTHGYRGHRLGGGHLMSDVTFDDYVEASARKDVQPRYFVFTAVATASNGQLSQSLRRGYGDSHTPDWAPSVCGTAEDWMQWFDFPAWFRDMVVSLQKKQKAPFTGTSLDDAFSLFQVHPAQNMVFFAQGARFAASKEAIQSRPKEYYEQLLQYMNHDDPWAGYFLEWMWWYVLGGSDAPCGFENTLSQHQLSWSTSNNPKLVLQQLSGAVQVVQNSTTTTVAGPITTTQTITTSVVQFTQPTTISPNIVVTVQTATTVTFASNAPVTIGQGASLVISSVQVVVFQATVVTIPTTGVLEITQATTTFTSTVITGGGRVRCKNRGRAIQFFRSVIRGILEVDGSTSGRRLLQSTTAPTQLCGSDVTTVTLVSNGVQEIQVNCTMTSETRYSNIISTLSYATGSTLLISGVSTSSLPTLVSTFSPAASQIPFTVRTADTSSSFTRDIIYYTNSGSCPSSYSVTVQNCPTGKTCTLKGSTAATNSSLCAITYSQVVSDDENGALFGLIALVALVPILAAVGFAVWYFFLKPEEPLQPPIQQEDLYYMQSDPYLYAAQPSTPVGAFYY